MSKAYIDCQNSGIDGYNDDMSAYKKQLDQNRRIMSDQLDDKLRAYYTAAHIPVPGYAVGEDEFVAQIRQAFTDAGYIKVEDDIEVKDNVIRLKDLHLMTGPEFYERFIKEAKHELGYTDEQIGAIDYRYAVAAKRAAGIEDKPQGV